jgi:hypothetical protein
MQTFLPFLTQRQQAKENAQAKQHGGGSDDLRSASSSSSSGSAAPSKRKAFLFASTPAAPADNRSIFDHFSNFRAERSDADGPHQQESSAGSATTAPPGVDCAVQEMQSKPYRIILKVDLFPNAIKARAVPASSSDPLTSGTSQHLQPSSHSLTASLSGWISPRRSTVLPTKPAKEETTKCLVVVARADKEHRIREHWSWLQVGPTFPPLVHFLFPLNSSSPLRCDGCVLECRRCWCRHSSSSTSRPGTLTKRMRSISSLFKRSQVRCGGMPGWPYQRSTTVWTCGLLT